MKRYILPFFMLVITLLVACSKEEGMLEPSGIKSGYFPQGNNDYDITIKEFYDLYQSNFLYEFTDKDVYWTPSAWADSAYGVANYKVEKANVAYVSQQLSLLEKSWLDLYSKDFLVKFLPVKIMLCSKVYKYDWDFSSWPVELKPFEVGAYYNYDNISVSYGSEDVTSMTKEDTLAFAKTVNRSFAESMYGRRMMEPTDDFSKVVNYNNASTAYSNSDLWALGILQPYWEASANNDWKTFVFMMTTYSEEYLNREVSYVDDWDYFETSWEGIFSALKDTQGLLKKRYNMVRQYYIDNYNIDLQTIGNYVDQ